LRDVDTREQGARDQRRVGVAVEESVLDLRASSTDDGLVGEDGSDCSVGGRVGGQVSRVGCDVGSKSSDTVGGVIGGSGASNVSQASNCSCHVVNGSSVKDRE